MSLPRYTPPDTLPQLCCGEDMHQHANGELECQECGHTLPADHLDSNDHDFELERGFDAAEGDEGEGEDDARS